MKVIALFLFLLISCGFQKESKNQHQIGVELSTLSLDLPKNLVENVANLKAEFGIYKSGTDSSAG